MQIGNFHPLLVHLPIGILVFAFLLELYQRWKKQDSSGDIVLFALGLGAFTAFTSAATGWFLGDSGGYEEEMLFRHKWIGIAFTVCSILLFLVRRSTKPSYQRMYMPLFVVVMVLLTITGHLGGSMTHGEDFLFQTHTENEIIIENVDEALVYGDIIRPIINNKCVSCHNTSKAKGGLLMTTKEQLLAGGDSGSPFDTIEHGKALMLHRIHLPIEDKEHMPPKGKVQLTDDEKSLLEWWMANDHCFDCLTVDLERTEEMKTLLTSLEEDTSPRALIAKEVDAISEDWLASLNQNNITAYPLSEESNLIIASMSKRKDISKKDMKLLRKNAENIVELDMANSNFNDTLAKLLPDFEHLTKLQLQNTAITDKAIDLLSKLEHLESLNLYGTGITEKALAHLKKIPALKNVYLWQTEIDRETLAEFSSKNPTLAIGYVSDSLFAESTLQPPIIVSETSFFKDSLEVVLDYVFEDAILYYTLDGSEPDTTSNVYSEPLLLDRSTTVKALTYKDGWGISDVQSASFKKSMTDYDTIVLSKKPHEKYAGQGAKTLMDLKRGTNNFVDGNWLGYEGEHFSTIIKLNETRDISEVSIGSLSAPSSYIFHPRGFTVFTSLDGKNFKKIRSARYPEQEPTGEVERTFFDLPIPPTKAKYVKVEVKSQLKNPSWHQNPQGKSWVFIDEIVLN